MAIVTLTVRRRSVRNHCVIEVLVAFFVLSRCFFLIFCVNRGYRQRTESDLFLFLAIDTHSRVNMSLWFHFIIRAFLLLLSIYVIMFLIITFKHFKRVLCGIYNQVSLQYTCKIHVYNIQYTWRKVVHIINCIFYSIHDMFLFYLNICNMCYL